MARAKAKARDGVVTLAFALALAMAFAMAQQVWLVAPGIMPSSLCVEVPTGELKPCGCAYAYTHGTS